jgi:hemerythrin-like domain-containing protein
MQIGMPIQLGATPDHDFSEPVGMMKDCHRRIEMFLKAIQFTVQGSSDGMLAGEVAEAFERALLYFRTAGPRHTADEEESLFPRLRGREGGALERLAALESDHRRAEELHAVVEELGRQWLRARLLSAVDLERLQQAVEEIGGIYASHIRIEDEEIFPWADTQLDAAEKAAIGREMAVRRGI